MKLKLLKKEEEAKGTKSFFWQTEKEIKFLPGQFFYFTLPKLNFPDPRGATRHFTISSSPTETGYIQFTTRIREGSGYKKTLDTLPIGAEIEGDGPNGTFILGDDEAGPHIFLAGGIGITPFRSMIKYVAAKNLKHQIYLIYSDSTPEEMPFQKELQVISKSHPNIKIRFVFTKSEGRLDEAKIKEITNHQSLVTGHSTWWLCGPPGFVDAMEQILGNLQVPLGRVRAEKFTGY